MMILVPFDFDDVPLFILFLDFEIKATHVTVKIFNIVL